MTNEERDIIAQFIQRVSGAQPTGFAGGGGSVPAATPALPPVDREADTYIGQLMTQYPDARYRLTQTAFVQEHALVEAQNRIKRLEWELDQARQAAQQAQSQAEQQQGSRSGGFLGGLFGGGSGQNRAAPPPQGAPVWNQGAAPPPQYAQQAAPPPPQYPPNYQPGMLPRQGSGFLGSALTTAAGVAGGLVVGNALMDMFSPHQALGGGMGGFGGGLGGGMGSPWAAPGAIPEPPMPPPDTGYVDQSSWTTPDPDPGAGGGTDAGWSDPGGGSDPGGDAGWDTGGGSDDDSI